MPPFSWNQTYLIWFAVKRGVQKISPFFQKCTIFGPCQACLFFSISKRGYVSPLDQYCSTTGTPHQLLSFFVDWDFKTAIHQFFQHCFFGPFWSDTFFSSKMSEAPVFFCCKLSEHFKVVPKETHLLLSKPKGGTAVCAQKEFHEISAIQSKKIATYAAVVMVIICDHAM